MEILRTKKVNGVEMTEFNATPRMRAFAFHFTVDPENRGKDPEQILQMLGFPKKLWKEWLAFDPWFTEWLEEVSISYNPKNIARTLEFIGLEKAFKGDFQFWKPFALKHKVIEADGVNVNFIPANLGAFNEWSNEDVQRHRNSLLSTLRGVEDKGRHDLAPGDIGGESEGDSLGITPVLERSVVLDEILGPDRERSREN